MKTFAPFPAMAGLALCSALLAAGPLFSQNKGAAPIANPQSAISNPQSTRAVVIGISDYQEEKIPDLRFADRDAEAFAEWLRSEAGGNLPADRIALLTNEKAKVGNIVAALTWLLDECRAGERAVIYFSGHGDVEKATMFQRGYLLAYDMPPTNYMAGGINVRDVQDVVSTLSNRGVQVAIITDACRAGKLAGSETGGAQATAAALQQQFANEIKVLSCQPDEFSIEGEQWGGGRGAFSFHLIDGLCGLADRNGDGQVSLLEIGNYLQEAVPKETAPQSQIPMTVGNPKARLASVSEPVLLAVKTKKAGQPPVFSPIEQKGIEKMILAKADSSIRETYAAFLAAIEKGDLLAPAGRSADDYYRRLIAEPGIGQLHGLMKRNFAAALQNEAQVVTNKLLQTDPFIVSDAFSRPFVFDHIPAYLARAAEILGEAHFFYKYLKAKQLFFEAKTCLPDKFPDLPPDSVVRMAVSKFEAALRFDSSAAYAHAEFGFLLWYTLHRVEDALQHAHKALELSPNWAYAHYLAGNCYRGDASQSVPHLKRAIELDPTFLLPYQELYMVYMANQEQAKHVFYRDLYIEKVNALMASDPQKVPVYYQTLLGGSLFWAGRWEEAEPVLLKAEELSKGQDYAVYQYLGATWRAMVGAYLQSGRKEEAEKIRKKALESKYILSGVEPPQIGVAEVYLKMGHRAEAKPLFEKVIAMLPNPLDPFPMNFVGRSYLGLGNLQAMEQTIDNALKAAPGDKLVFYQAACLWSLAKDEQKALEWLEKALEKGFKDGALISTDSDLDNIRLSPGFKALMKKHFPEKVKD